jgi:hypothetical protein
MAPQTRNTSFSLDQFNNPDVAYAEYMSSIDAYAVRIAAASDPSVAAHYSHQSYFQSATGDLTFNNGGSGVATFYGSPTIDDANNLYTKNIKVIDFASNTGVPMVGPGSFLGGNATNIDDLRNTHNLLPRPYHLVPSDVSTSTVAGVRNITISDVTQQTAYSAIEEIGFYSFSGKAR